MTDNRHSRAQELFAQSLVEGISSADRSWLDAHLRDCPDCAREILATQDLLGALRSVPLQCRAIWRPARNSASDSALRKHRLLCKTATFCFGSSPE